MKYLPSLDIAGLALADWVLHAPGRLAGYTAGMVKACLWPHLDVRTIYAFRRLFRRLAPRSAATLSSDLTAAANRAWLLGDAARRRHSELWRRKHCMDEALSLGHRRLWRDVEQCARELDRFAATLEDPGKPVIFAPIHMMSDHLAAAVCALAGARHASVISAYPERDVTGKEARIAARYGAKLDRINSASIDGAELRTLVRAVKRKETNLVIFPDALPEITGAMTGKRMRTCSAKLFGRNARLYRGIDDLARLTGATVVYFLLHDRAGRVHAHVAGALAANEVSRKSPAMLERAIRHYPDEWLLWHSPSLFYFNA